MSPAVHFDVSRCTLQPELKCLNCWVDALTPDCEDSRTKSHLNCGKELFFGLQSNSETKSLWTFFGGESLSEVLG